HTFLGEKLPSWESTAALVKKISDTYRLPYYTMSPTYSVCRSHGYLPGEQYTCPHCGARTEVYSRITGYYRPVQNWNDGKLQEFKDRKEYTILDWKKHKELEAEAAAKKAAEEAEKAEDATPVKATLLFTTKTCPNCRTAIGLLERNGVEYRRLDAYEEQELALRFDIRTAPTLVVIEGENVERFEGVGAINRYCQTLANGESVTA
ncbi:MAG: ribonucleoside triphosphate reductase, partial [Clostridia bacterium]|nr:ribonucleoside triphosphate reductase [Clostridia bacterium]